ncbi:hypothetical protein AMECASPLE_024245 [Ameca splendens]|uniref:Uncharacterized protein n=1 Tax=Ameca splendens TaxID=208324 RepID=A0ABV0ZE63_9TELE
MCVELSHKIQIKYIEVCGCNGTTCGKVQKGLTVTPNQIDTKTYLNWANCEKTAIKMKTFSHIVNQTLTTSSLLKEPKLSGIRGRIREKNKWSSSHKPPKPIPSSSSSSPSPPDWSSRPDPKPMQVGETRLTSKERQMGPR